MADLTAEEDEELKEIRGAGARRDFSVIFSHSRNVNHLFLGPARFVNVSILITCAPKVICTSFYGINVVFLA
jgi:hypothetical protein